MKSFDKLKSLTGESIPKAKVDEIRRIHLSSPSGKPKIDELRQLIEIAMNRRSRKPKISTVAENNLANIIPGKEMENEHGKFFLVSDILSRSTRHGHRNISEAFDFDMSAAAMLANNPSISEHCSSDALFLDTETTGLIGNKGTMAFLIGLGWFDEGSFHVRQILARDSGEERASLFYLLQIAGMKKFLVTFNGKAIDINLLTTRLNIKRLKSDLAEMPHLDLLHPSRRILGHRLENNRLVTLEEQVLGVQREGDIPGWEIPQRYFDWLRSRNGRLLEAIFEHNRLDVISMATLTAHLVDILNAQALRQYAHTDDYLAAARLLLARADTKAVDKILSIFQENICKDFSHQSKIKLAHLYKHTGKLDEAVKFWRELAWCDPVGFYAISELAKWLEHHLHDYQQAELLLGNALNQPNTFSIKEKNSLLHRLKRLHAKLEE